MEHSWHHADEHSLCLQLAVYAAGENVDSLVTGTDLMD